MSDKNEDDVQQQVAIEHSKDCLSSSGDSDEITNLIQSTNQVIISESRVLKITMKNTLGEKEV